MTNAVPDKPSLDGLEAKWSRQWDESGTYAFDRHAPREAVFAIDTPPPTVSGSLHVGHIFSYTHTDTIARFKRMMGLSVWYPLGWDDNGLPTERRVQNYFGVRCDPSLPYDPSFTPPAQPGKEIVAVSRPNFVDLCRALTEEDEKAFEELFHTLGLSVQWANTYTTIGFNARRTSQRAFLRDLARGQAYTAEAPTLWDVTFETAVAQAELEDRETDGTYHRINFHRPGGEELSIETTRPELLAACVALVAHPSDARYSHLFGTEAITPLFGARVPVLAHQLAQPDKGTGMAMICTFGDVTDVVWWRELHLPTRSIVGRNGRLLHQAPSGLSEEGAGLYLDDLAGKTLHSARQRVVELLAASGELVGEPRAIKHQVKFYEKGSRPLEIVTSRQWFIRTLDHQAKLLERGRELHWHPPYMRARYESWVEGLNTDWLISRQRFFGVPFPLWYRLDEHGERDYQHPLVPDEDRLPVDPSTDRPDGFDESQRDQPGGFCADPDVMDTWATSSLTPQIAGGWLAGGDDDGLWERLWPMDLRPQAHEIIRTWLFSTVVRAQLEFDSLPWTDVAISGWILDPDRKKMSKSKGNVVTPLDLLERFGSDAVRYWAASGRPGTDTTFDEGQMKVGRKLAIKLLNASRFVLSEPPAGVGAPAIPVPGSVPRGDARGDGAGAEAVGGDAATIADPLDRAMLSRLAGLVDEATAALESYDYARALERTESFFWAFCDDYLELVKRRAYGDAGAAGAASARAALSLALSVLLRMFAPFLPFVTAEVWSWCHPGSVHNAPWPHRDEVPSGGEPEVWDVVSAILGDIRRAKTEAKASMRATVELVVVTDTEARLALGRQAQADLADAGCVTAFRWEPVASADLASVEVILASQ
jgi:valyl-tRNA synthetase